MLLTPEAVKAEIGDRLRLAQHTQRFGDVTAAESLEADLALDDAPVTICAEVLRQSLRARACLQFAQLTTADNQRAPLTAKGKTFGGSWNYFNGKPLSCSMCTEPSRESCGQRQSHRQLQEG